MMEDTLNRKKILFALTLLVIIVLTGVVGFMEIENYDLVDAFYMTIITLTTVGFDEVHPLNDNGKIFTAILSFMSLGFYAYSISVVTTFLVEGKLKKLFRGYKYKSPDKMENHVIVVGHGRIGQQAVTELQAYGSPYVVVDKTKEALHHHEEFPISFVQGDATMDGILLKAGITKARAIIITLSSDADNLFVALSARTLNPEIIIVCRASSASNEKKLKMAGVHSIVMPEKVGGARMAKLIARPDIVEFLDYLTANDSDPAHIEEVACSHLTAKCLDKAISDIGLRKITGANIIGLKTPQGQFIINPEPETKLADGMKLIVLGTNEQLSKVKSILSGGEKNSH